jgi:exonuclease III
MDMRFGTGNVRSMYRAVAEEITKYKLDLVGVQEVRWDRGGTGNDNHELGAGFFVHKRIMSAVKRVEYISDTISYIILRGCWCDIILNVHAPTEDKIGDMKDRFYEELEHAFDKFPKYDMKILLGDLNSKLTIF